MTRITDFPMKMKVREGVLFYEDGSEVVLWGNNFQPNLYWEYKFRMEHMGIPMTSEVMKDMCDDGFRDLATMGCDLIRCHLTPADFTDADGNLVDTMWLDMLGYLVAKARENGVYVYITFLNQMEYVFVEDSFVPKFTREEWIFDPHCVEKTQNMIRQLVNWTNPYNGLKLKDDDAICVWGLINEPEYLTFDQMESSPLQQGLFEKWTTLHDGEPGRQAFSRYRSEVVKGYIDSMHDLLRDEGSSKPVVWNCNWPRMIQGRSDVFSAIAESQAEAVAFCLYPGQDDVGDPFMENAADMSGNNYLPFLQHCFDDYDHLGWLRSAEFAGKAKVVYEFETMYNEKSSYLHPAMAKLFRALGVQMATMWTHCFNIYSSHMGCAHNLNLKTTPKKAASYIVAGQVFRQLSRGFEFKTLSDVHDVFDTAALSYEHDVSIIGTPDLFIHSGGVSWCPVEVPSVPARIIGYGSSPLVSYQGRGLYMIDIEPRTVRIELYPHARFIRDAWQWHADGGLVTELDEETAVPFEFRIPGFKPIMFEKPPGSYTFPLVVDHQATWVKDHVSS
ncbi:hypothetical protein PDESU_01588 [Pontiella desulfatans]|uniref:Glycoside hydrolase family 5 domain-containing protein n=1 Tax=Pontiella desulfatans TaxID=2750659 RepID=A0A6C2TZZ1_PONDE|nr:hypothetical protein [Pontiella desulfatans]VGO13034.1 hypothetical protein PDESU_01588 [Pontiella desulfatans]